MPAAEFHRLVLAVAHGEAGPALLACAAEAARLLRLALHCVLIEDEALAQLHALPFARELRLPNHQWQKLDPARLAAEQAATEAALRRTLAGLADRHGIAQALEVQRGDPEQCFGSLCVAGDIVVLAEAAPAPHQAERLRRLAQSSPAAVLLLPPAPAAPDAAAQVTALVSGPDDPARDVAERIAAAAGATLAVVSDEGGIRDGRLVVVSSRAAWPEGLARRHGVAVLVV